MVVFCACKRAYELLWSDLAEHCETNEGARRYKKFHLAHKTLLMLRSVWAQKVGALIGYASAVTARKSAKTMG